MQTKKPKQKTPKKPQPNNNNKNQTKKKSKKQKTKKNLTKIMSWYMHFPPYMYIIKNHNLSYMHFFDTCGIDF